MADQAAQICKRLDALRSQRTVHEEVWRECFDYTYPLRGSGLNEDVLDAQRGLARKARVLDSTATDSVRILASALMSGLTPANSRWFALDVSNESDAERKWFDATAQSLWENIHAANFDSAAFEACIDVVCAGWFALYVDEDRTRGGYTFEQWPLAGIYCVSSKPGGTVDTVYRPYRLTAEQAVAEFGDECSTQTQKLAKDKPDELVDFVHAIYPRTDYKEGSKLAKNLPFASCKVEVKSRIVVSESGYHELPVIVPRWMLIPETAYGVGPVFDALPDIRTLNELLFNELAAADLAVGGMWIAEDDGVLNARTIKLGPRKVIVANSVDSMKELKSGANFDVSFTKSDQLRGSIRKVLLADQLQAQDGPAMTATEVHVRVALIRQLLGPIYGRLQAEYLQPLINRCFGLAYRAGIFAPPPPSLAGREFTVRYISPLARAQKLETVTALERFTNNLGALAQAKGDQSVWDVLNTDIATREMSDALGVPDSMLNDQDEIDKRRKQRMQSQQAAQQQQMMAPVAQEAGKAMVNRVAA